MDGSRFDAWTRRRVGLAAGGAIGSLLGLLGGAADDADAKKRKKRCRKLGQNCTQGGRRQCCKKKGLSCQIFEEGNSARRCCRRGNEPCTISEECCSQECDSGVCQCKGIGTPCGGADPLCCSLNCVEGLCAAS